jgi:2-polyprenyl-6-hydroxyphenyl methylase/3-demethylubiquinone-9 3-methyltransferase
MSETAEISAKNVSASELNHFASLSARWWDPEGPSRPLMALNPVRLAFIEQTLQTQKRTLKGLRTLDVGCGGGLLSEAMAHAGADVIGVDLSPELLEVAKLHALGSGLTGVEYQLQSAEDMAQMYPEQFDLVTCMEMLEHVPEPESVLDACVKLLKPGGLLALSTLNRTPKAFALGIVAAEYVFNLVPKGTHSYAQFLKPAEIARVLRARGMEITALKGMQYAPLSNTARLNDDSAVNFILAALKPQAT